jgi:hypothetical protein
MKKHFLYFFLVLCMSSLASAQTIQVLNIPDGPNSGGRTTNADAGYHLNGNDLPGASMVNAKAKLTNLANFGSGGTVSQAINITDGFGAKGSITSLADINGFDIIFIGSYYRSSPTDIAFTPGELNILLDWSRQAGKVLMTQEQTYSGSPVSAAMGYTITNGSNTNPTTQLPADQQQEVNIFSGAFGSASTLDQAGFSQGYFTGDCVGIPLAANANGLTTILFNTEFRDVLIADTDFFTNLSNGAGDMSSGGTITSSTDRAWANLWAWAVNEVVNNVDPSDNNTTGGTAYSDQTMPLCFGQGAVLKLQDYNGAIKRWQTSTDGGTSWTDINISAPTLTVPTFTDGQMYRAVIQNSPTCPEAFSTPVTVTKNLQPVAGAAMPNTVGPLCSLSNTGVLSISGQSGVIAEWQTSTDNGTSWASIPGTNGSASYTFTDAQNLQQFRVAMASSLSCAQAAPNGDLVYSSVSTISASVAECCAAGDVAPVANN